MTYLGATLAAKDSQISSLTSQLSAAQADVTYWQNQYTAANSARPPSGVTNYDVGLANSSGAPGTYNIATWSAPKSGYYAIHLEGIVGGTGGDYNSGSTARMTIAAPFGSTTGPQTGIKPDNNTADTAVSAWAVGFIGAGGVVTFQWWYSGSANNSRTISSCVARIRFIPEFSYPN
jgi:hypothetical protein